ncbi:MAG TPA: carbon-nitrogen hydrolase family protein [Terriglobia bacterium]|nr:carbon-nitrogen hydrolase family protein [Terriglobia bacterium]
MDILLRSRLQAAEGPVTFEPPKKKPFMPLKRRRTKTHRDKVPHRTAVSKLAIGLSATMSLAAVCHAQVRVAVCQILVIDGDRQGNFRRIEYALKAARAEHADIATFPESSILGWENPDAHTLATPIPGADSDRIAALARKYRMMISIGLDEQDGEQLYDSAILVAKTGKLLWKYRKIRVLPQLMKPPYSRGKPSGIGVVDTPFGRIGVVICADTFTDAYVRRMASLKPDLMLVPYGWAAPANQWPAHEKDLERLVSSRAKLWKCPTVGTDLVGEMTHGPWKGYTYGGGSVVADSTGAVLAVLRDRDTDVRVVELPLDQHTAMKP